MANTKKASNPKHYIPPHKRQLQNIHSVGNSLMTTSPNTDSYNDKNYSSTYNTPHRHQQYHSNKNYDYSNNNNRYKQSRNFQSSYYNHDHYQQSSYNHNNNNNNYNINNTENNQNLSSPNSDKNDMTFLNDCSDNDNDNDNDEYNKADSKESRPQKEKEKEKESESEGENECDLLFEEYLNKYKIQHKKKYIAPFQIRRLRKEYDSNKKHAMKRICKQKEKENVGLENEQTEHQESKGETYSFPMEYLFFRDFYVKNSEYYSEWQNMRHTGWNNKHLEKFFDLKHKNQDNVSRSSDKNIISLFRRFYRYAIDIDNVCHYRQNLLDLLNKDKDKKLFFLDIGFAPGGMSRFLLDANPSIYGIGITLPPYESGNAFIPELLHSTRFLCREHDIVELGKKINNRSDFLSKCIENDYCNDHCGWNGINGFGGFDLVIIGITCHQDFTSNHRLDHQILLSELYLAFLTLNDGGSILIRHKIALDCIHQHILYIFLSCFDSYFVGKPMTEFAIRKTFWILWTGFDKHKCKQLKLVYFLGKLIHEYDGNKPPYGKNPATQQYHNPKMIEKTPQQIVDELHNDLDAKKSMIAVMDPVFFIQMKSLRSFCSGKKDKLCKRSDCKRSDCNRAHSKEECIDGFYEALLNVDNVLRKEIQSNRHHSKILTSLHKQIHKRHKNKQQYSCHDNINEFNDWRKNQ